MNKIAEPNRGFEPDMAYPQYAYRYVGKDISISVDAWVRLQEFVLEHLNDGPCHAVQSHFDSILLGIVPFGIKIVRAVKED